MHLKRRLMPLGHAVYKLYWRIFRPTTVGVKLLLARQGKITLVRHTYGQKAVWNLVGGGVQRGETPEQAARREAREEVGATLGALRLFGVYANFGEGKNDHVVVFVCEDFTMTAVDNAEIGAVGEFCLDALPADVSKAARRRVAEYLQPAHVPSAGEW